MLADPLALEAAFGTEHVLPAPPEEIEDPKSVWATYAGAASATDDDMRRAALDALRGAVVAQRCPRGFAPFRQDLQSALTGVLI